MYNVGFRNIAIKFLRTVSIMRFAVIITFRKRNVKQRDIFGNPLTYCYEPKKVVTLPAYPSIEVAKKQAKLWIKQNLPLETVTGYKNRQRYPHSIVYHRVPEEKDFGKYQQVKRMVEAYHEEKISRMRLVK